MCLHQWQGAVKPECCSTDTRSFPVATSKEEMTLSTPSVLDRALVVLLQTAEGEMCSHRRHYDTRLPWLLAHFRALLQLSTATHSICAGKPLGFYGWEWKLSAGQGQPTSRLVDCSELAGGRCRSLHSLSSTRSLVFLHLRHLRHLRQPFH